LAELEVQKYLPSFPYRTAENWYTPAVGTYCSVGNVGRRISTGGIRGDN